MSRITYEQRRLSAASRWRLLESMAPGEGASGVPGESAWSFTSLLVFVFFFFLDILCCCFTKPREPLHLIPMDIRQSLRLLGVTPLSESVQEKSLKIHCPVHKNVAKWWVPGEVNMEVPGAGRPHPSVRMQEVVYNSYNNPPQWCVLLDNLRI